MDRDMSLQWGSRWQQMVFPIPGQLAKIVGIEPKEPEFQAEMHRVFCEENNDCLDKTTYNGEIIPISRLMITPIT
jgi:hypothetical protein